MPSVGNANFVDSVGQTGLPPKIKKASSLSGTGFYDTNFYFSSESPQKRCLAAIIHNRCPRRVPVVDRGFHHFNEFIKCWILYLLNIQ
jgi:hypothetical protein